MLPGSASSELEVEMNRPLFSCVIPVKGKRPYFDEGRGARLRASASG